MEQHLDRATGAVDLVLLLPWLAALALYGVGVARTRRRTTWPVGRAVLWTSGIAVCACATTGPLAARSHHGFPDQMVTHLLLGMLGPLLLVLSAPVTLALRALPVRPARILVRVVSSPPVRFLTQPVTAGLSNVGGLWILYSTDLFSRTQTDPTMHALVHAHVLISSYVFTAAIIGVDPDRHRRSFTCRAGVLVLVMAAHSILAKRIYASPPAGVEAEQAEVAGMVMYYGGDLLGLVVLVIFCHRWYVKTEPRIARVSARTQG